MYEFGYLKPISRAIYVIGVIVLIIGFIIGSFFFASGDSLSVLAGIGIIVGTGLLFLLCFATSELIKLLVQIEYNTRK